MKFRFTRLPLEGLIEVEHEQVGDERGHFSEVFRAGDFAEAGIPGPFVQENQSRSERGVLRGLHYQILPKAQGKLVRCLRGSIYDVAVDIRKDSPTFGRWHGVVLTGENRKMLYIPPGFAHGFYVADGPADVLYKTTDYHSPEHERGVRWDDPALAIAWPPGPKKVSSKDAALPPLDKARRDF